MSYDRDSLFCDENFRENLGDTFIRENRRTEGCGCSNETFRGGSPEDRLCRTIRESEISSGRIIGEACEEFNKIRCRQSNSNTDLLCRTNRAANMTSARILREACEDFRNLRNGCRRNETTTDILCRLNRQAEMASSAILRETCREYHENKCRNNETTTDILCNLNRQAERVSGRILGETCGCSQGYGNYYGENWDQCSCAENYNYGFDRDGWYSGAAWAGNSQWSQWPQWQQWQQWPQQGWYGYEDNSWWIIILLLFFCGGAGFWCF